MPPKKLTPARRKVNRGSTRRITRALENADTALMVFQKEMDIQVYLADKDGNRAGEHPIVEMVKSFRAELTAQVNALAYPEAEPEAEPEAAE